MSSDIIPALYNASLTVFILNNDDIYQGILIKKVGVNTMNHDGFRNFALGTNMDTCTLRKEVWTLHGFSGARLRLLWGRFVTTTRRC